MNRANVQRRENSSLIKTESADEIPVVHRLAIIYLMLPVVIWLVGWFEWWFGVPAAVLMALGLWQALRPARSSLKWQVFSGALRSALRPTTVLLLLIALAWVMTTAAGGVFDVHNPEWHKHRAIFLDLSRFKWPVYLPSWTPDLSVYLSEDAGQPGSLLRYYLGYYIVPGLLGKWLGPSALNWAVPLWSWAGVGLMLLMFTRGYAGWKALAAAVILIAFSGMDIVTVLLFDGWEWLTLRVTLDGWPQIWLGRVFLERNVHEDIKVLFHSHMYGLMWVPQHFLPGALYALLLLQLRRHKRFLAISGVVISSALLWSPFVAVGLLLFVTVWAIQKGISPFLRWQNLLVSPLIVVLLLTYLSSGTEEIPNYWLWEVYSWRAIGLIMPVLYLTEFLLLAVLLTLLRPQLRGDLFFLASIATMLLLPSYYYGLHNDLVLRGLVPALAVLCAYCANVILNSPRGSKQAGRSSRRIVFTGLIVAVLSVGAVSPLFELARANNEHNFSVVRYSQLVSNHSILQIQWVATTVHYQYIAQDIPDWFRWLLRDRDWDTQKPYERGEEVIRSVYTVYRDDRRLVYVKDLCGPEEVDTSFFLHVVPVDRGVLPPGHSHFSYNFRFRGYGWRIGEACLAVRELPNSYGIGHVITGQFNLERTGHSWLRHYFSDVYRDRLLSEAGEPIIRSFYEVYLHQVKVGDGSGEASRSRLFYFRPGCGQDEIGTRFFLHVIPESAEDLPDHRKEAGYEELDFALEDYGGRYGGDCFAVRDLPEYDILEIRTGQTTGENSNSWQGSYTLGN